MSQYTVNLHVKPEIRQMSVYHLCYCLQSLLLLLRKTSSSAVQKRHSKVDGNLIAPSLYSILLGQYQERYNKSTVFLLIKLRGSSNLPSPLPFQKGMLGNGQFINLWNLLASTTFFVLSSLKRKKMEYWPLKRCPLPPPPSLGVKVNK